VSLLIDTNRSSGPASAGAWPKALNGDAETDPMPSRVNRLTFLHVEDQGKP